MTMASTTFAAPGPGSWQIDAVHWPRPVTRLFAEIFPGRFDAGFREAARTYGAMLETLEFEAVNGFLYFALRPVGPRKGARGLPPKSVFKLLQLLHPEVRRRLASASATFASKRWRQELRVWDEERKPASIRTHLTLQAVDPAGLETEALIAHIARCLDQWGRMLEQHHRFDFAALLPVGDFIVHAAAWTGLEPAKIGTL